VPDIDGYLSLEAAKKELARISKKIENTDCSTVDKLSHNSPILTMRCASCKSLLDLINMYVNNT
jgi:hypothetical protein